jgi:hypothetical protein
VIDFENVGTEASQRRRNLAEQPRTVGDGQAERDDAVVAFEFAHHDRGQDARIDVAAAQDEADADVTMPGDAGILTDAE